MCVSSCTVRTRDVTYVMVRLHIGYGALVVGAVQCDIAHLGVGATPFADDAQCKCGGDAERAVVVIVVNPGPSRSDLDGWMQSTRVRDDMGSRCGIGVGFQRRRQLLGNGMNHGQKGKVARAWVPYCPRPKSSGEWTFRARQIDGRGDSTAPVGRHDWFTLEVMSRGRRGGDEVTGRTKTLHIWSQRKQTDHDVYIWSKHGGRRVVISRRTTRTVPQRRPFQS